MLQQVFRALDGNYIGREKCLEAITHHFKTAHGKSVFLCDIQSSVNSSTLLFSHNSIICK